MREGSHDVDRLGQFAEAGFGILNAYEGTRNLFRTVTDIWNHDSQEELAKRQQQEKRRVAAEPAPAAPSDQQEEKTSSKTAYLEKAREFVTEKLRYYFDRIFNSCNM